MTSAPGGSTGTLRRGLGLLDAVGVGIAAMVGAGLFVVFAPAAAAAGDGLPFAILLAAAIAVANAVSSARLAAVHPQSGGTYVYGREQLGVPWGHLAGWAFITGKTASCAAMAMTIGVHLFPDASRVVAVVTVLAVLALNLQGVQRSARVALAIAVGVLALVVTFAVVLLVSPPALAEAPLVDPVVPGGPVGIAQGAGFLFFAFAGYARMATLGEEVADPRRTIPRAIAIALGIVLAVYVLVAVALTQGFGVGWLAARQAPLAEAAEISAWPWLGPALRIAAVVAAGGALLALTLGVSRTVLAMARDRHLPPVLALVDGPHAVPRRAEAVVTAVVIVLIVLGDLDGAIGFSSFCVLVYYAIANASAWTLEGGWVHRVIPTLGLLGCLGVAVLLPVPSVIAGVVVLLVGATTGWVRHTTRE